MAVRKRSGGPTRPGQSGGTETAITDAPCPRTEISNPLPSSGESDELRSLGDGYRLELRQLRYFAAVARERNFTRLAWPRGSGGRSMPSISPRSC
jgi:hypothetical protein